MLVTDKTVGFIGAGNMAEALIRSMLGSGIVQPAKVWASDVSTDRGRYLTDKYGINFLEDNKDLIIKVDIIIYAVKPLVISKVLGELSHLITEKQIHISVAAGISIKAIEQFLPKGAPVIRVMPNTPCLVGAGASAYAVGRNVEAEEEKVVTEILNCTGISVKVPENLMNAVTGLSGSGPAYVFLIIEALVDAGVKTGLPRDIAMVLATQTVLGSAKMIQETGEHPARLKDRVTTPGGTTIAALHVLEQGKLRATLMDAVLASTNRAEELGAGK